MKKEIDNIQNSSQNFLFLLPFFFKIKTNSHYKYEKRLKTKLDGKNAKQNAS